MTHLVPAHTWPRADTSLAARLAVSRRASQGVIGPTSAFDDWFSQRLTAGQLTVERVPLSDVAQWEFDPDTGNLGHRSGRFFAIAGMRVTAAALDGPLAVPPVWHQPIINQPETGILGIIIKEIDGILHFLMQAKMEPGNPNFLQLSPTVQATRSNYTRVHNGTKVKYLEYFAEAGRGRIIADALQSEHGSWFYRKRNRNMVVEVTGDIPVEDGFCWLTLGQLGELLHKDNVVNMDARSVLSSLPVGPRADGTAGLAAHSDAAVMSWFTGERIRHLVRAELVPLRGLPGWTSDAHRAYRADGRSFEIVGVSVRAASREVTSWSQPLLRPAGPGVVAFLARNIAGIPHVLAHARVEGGFLDAVELGPTVQFDPGDDANQDHP